MRFCAIKCDFRVSLTDVMRCFMILRDFDQSGARKKTFVVMLMWSPHLESFSVGGMVTGYDFFAVLC